jgi:hypothetical protein
MEINTGGPYSTPADNPANSNQSQWFALASDLGNAAIPGIIDGLFGNNQTADSLTGGSGSGSGNGISDYGPSPAQAKPIDWTIIGIAAAAAAVAIALLVIFTRKKKA